MTEKEDTCAHSLENTLKILHKYRADPQITTAIAITLISISAKKLYDLTTKEMNELDLLIAIAVQDTTLNFMRELND